MTFELPTLPYAMDALEPYISQETLEYHYGKHHQAYVNKLNAMLPDSEFENAPLEDIIKESFGGLFNNAAQIWNHTFYWHSLSPNGGGEPEGDVLAIINASFGDFATFKEKFSAAAMNRFGSGWAWLVKNSDGTFEITSTENADTPMTEDKSALLTCDDWEHAYYVDTRNDRAKYIDNFWHLVNWEFVANNLNAA